MGGYIRCSVPRLLFNNLVHIFLTQHFDLLFSNSHDIVHAKICPEPRGDLAYENTSFIHVLHESDKIIVQLLWIIGRILIFEIPIDLTGETNVVIGGGFGLNCVANYEFLKRFPGITFYCDAVAHDGGTAIGLAKYAWYQHSGDTTIRPLKSLYLGTLPDYNQLEQVRSQVDFNLEDATYADVAKLIADGNIVTLFQGRSEAGPRALGNRSILFDPRVQDGKDIVNAVKHREWFRPFAGSVLAEKAADWFDLRTQTESPFMMYAVDVQPSKENNIPAITHVDGTCRVQTVTEEQNEHYYKLIKAFDELTGVPILFNTSFNLAGQPLVETVFDALVTIFNSDINYLYLPEIGKLISKK